jgi:hypothetical protein
VSEGGLGWHCVCISKLWKRYIDMPKDIFIHIPAWGANQ